MNILIVKLGATGDVVRTTALLRRLTGEITWITAPKNVALLSGVLKNVRCLAWEDRAKAADATYDLVINLEDTVEIGAYVKSLKYQRLFGAYLAKDDLLDYSDDARRWFDLSLISRHGRKQADKLKLQNRSTYQELIFEGLGYRFSGESYVLPRGAKTTLTGDVAIAAEAGPVWPMKNWAYYEILKRELETRGHKVNFLPVRSSLLEHLGDVENHRCLVGGDSLPMHLALGSKIPCVTLFTCTSPWEIHDYGIQKKLVSPLLEEFFYQRGFDKRATTAIPVSEVLDATLAQLGA
jgi:ADP-heptose:LPS heptosyltransferase